MECKWEMNRDLVIRVEATAKPFSLPVTIYYINAYNFVNRFYSVEQIGKVKNQIRNRTR